MQLYTFYKGKLPSKPSKAIAQVRKKNVSKNASDEPIILQLYPHFTVKDFVGKPTGREFARFSKRSGFREHGKEFL